MQVERKAERERASEHWTAIVFPNLTLCRITVCRAVLARQSLGEMP